MNKKKTEIASFDSGMNEALVLFSTQPKWFGGETVVVTAPAVIKTIAEIFIGG